MTFTAVAEGETLNALYRVDLASQEVAKLYQHSKADIAEAVVDQRSGAVVGVRVHGEQPEYHWLDGNSATAQLYAMLERRFAGQTVHITSTSEDASKALLLVTSGTNPGDYYILDVSRRQADFLMASRQGIDPAQMRAKQSVQIAARDGVTLHGYVTRPAAANGPALMGTVREPQLYRCAVGYSGIYDLSLLVKNKELAGYRLGPARYSDVIFGTVPVQLRQKSPVYNAERIQTPVLLMHGKRDRRADLAQASRMKDALERNDKPVEWLLLEDSKPDAEQTARVAAYERLLQFLDRHIGKSSLQR